MTLSTSQIKKRILSAEELDSIYQVSLTRRGDGSVVSPWKAYDDVLVKLWGILLDDTEWNKKTDGPTIIPSNYQIPDRQWRLIAKWISEMTEEGRVSFMLQFVNIGPSAYLEDE